MTVLELRKLACGYGRRTVLRDIDLSIGEGEFLCLLGPNGIGKTTLFKTVLRLLPPLAGAVRARGEDTAGWSAARFAAVVGYVPQAHVPPFPFTVRDVVAMGRTAHLGAFATPSRRDTAIAEESLDRLGAGTLAGRPYTEISGGERQLALIARALTQEPAVMVLDEPTSNLDYGNQIAVLDLIGELARDTGIAVVMTSHDPNHALLHATRVAALTRDGRLVTGDPAEVVGEEYLRLTYGVRARLIETPRPGGGIARVCLPLGKEVASCC
jgi:iron complex transport system ATP-binding protein